MPIIPRESDTFLFILRYWSFYYIFFYSSLKSGISLSTSSSVKIFLHLRHLSNITENIKNEFFDLNHLALVVTYNLTS